MSEGPPQWSRTNWLSGQAFISWYAISCWFWLMHISKGRSWVDRVLMLSRNCWDCDNSSGMTWRTRLNPQTASVRVSSRSSLKFLFSGLQAAMTPMSLCWLRFMISVKKTASLEISLSATSTSMKMLPVMQNSLESSSYFSMVKSCCRGGKSAHHS